MHPHEAGGVARVLLVVAPLGDVLADLYMGNVGREVWGHATPLGDVLLAHLVGGEVAPLDHRLAQLLADTGGDDGLDGLSAASAALSSVSASARPGGLSGSSRWTEPSGSG